MVQSVNNNHSNKFVASTAAVASGVAVSTGSLLITMPITNKLKKINKLPADKVEILHNAAEQIVQNTGLAEKGVKIKYIPESTKEIGFFQKIINPLAAIQAGENAAYTPKDIMGILFGKKVKVMDGNTILMPKKGMATASFHEIGHALNHNFSKSGKFLQKLRPVSMYAPLAIMAFAACTKNSKSKNEGEDLSTVQKTKNFIRNNAGKLSFLATVPMLIEEGMATIKGQKLAKSLLSKDMLKAVSKNNKIAYLTYLSTAVCAGLSAFAATKIKDKMTGEK